MRLARKRHAWSALVTHTAGGPLVAIHVKLHFIDNLLNDFFTGNRRNALLDIIQGLEKVRKFLAAGSFFVVITMAPRLALNTNDTVTVTIHAWF